MTFLQSLVNDCSRREEITIPFCILGVVSHVNGEDANITYLERTDRIGRNWVLPEDAEVQKTSFEQIMVSGFEVKYIQSTINKIRCTIDRTLAEELTEESKNISCKCD